MTAMARVLTVRVLLLVRKVVETLMQVNISRIIVLIAGLLALMIPAQGAKPAITVSNSWRGITPLRSSTTDVARIVGSEVIESEAGPNGPFKVEDGEVTFSYLTPSLAKIYKAPPTMVGKVFTIYFKPRHQQSRTELELTRDFKRCTEERDRIFYYFVSDAGVAYQFNKSTDTLETVIYQPTRVEVRRLAVNTECVF